MDGRFVREGAHGTRIDSNSADSPVEDWVEPFRRALTANGHSADRHKWNIIWARRLAGWAVRRGYALERLQPGDVERFLAHLATLYRSFQNLFALP